MSRDERDIEWALSKIRKNPRDEDAWNIFYTYFRPQVASVLYRSGLNAEDIRDIVQDTFLKFLNSAFSYRDDESQVQAIRAYLVVTAKHLAIDRHRSAARHKLREDASSESHPYDAPAAERDPVMALSAERMLGHLADDELRLLSMLQKGDSLSAIAFECEISYSAAAVRVHRLRQKVEKLLEDL